MKGAGARQSNFIGYYGDCGDIGYTSVTPRRTFGAEGPAGGRVEARDDDRHVRSSNRLRDRGAEEGGRDHAESDQLETDGADGIRDKSGERGEVEQQQAAVDEIAPREGRRAARDEALPCDV